MYLSPGDSGVAGVAGEGADDEEGVDDEDNVGVDDEEGVDDEDSGVAAEDVWREMVSSTDVDAPRDGWFLKQW